MSETHLIEPNQSGFDIESNNRYDKTQGLNHSNPMFSDNFSHPNLTQNTGEQQLKRQNSKAIPSDIVGYIEEHDINSIVKYALNKVLREMPGDPLATIAGILVAQARKSYPVFKRFEARKVYLCDN